MAWAQIVLANPDRAKLVQLDDAQVIAEAGELMRAHLGALNTVQRRFSVQYSTDDSQACGVIRVSADLVVAEGNTFVRMPAGIARLGLSIGHTVVADAVGGRVHSKVTSNFSPYRSLLIAGS